MLHCKISTLINHHFLRFKRHIFRQCCRKSNDWSRVWCCCTSFCHPFNALFKWVFYFTCNIVCLKRNASMIFSMNISGKVLRRRFQMKTAQSGISTPKFSYLAPKQGKLRLRWVSWMLFSMDKGFANSLF